MESNTGRKTRSGKIAKCGAIASAFFAFFISAAAQGAWHSFTATLEYSGDAASDVPALLRLSPDKPAGFSYADTDGTDLEIRDENGTLLPYEIDTWNTAGESLVWVKIPSFSNGAKLTIDYGRSTADLSVNAKSVWSGYKGVWHMESPKPLDATGDYASEDFHPGTTASSNLSAVEGRIGKGVKFPDTDENDIIVCQRNFDNALIAANGCFFEAWVKPAEYKANNAVFGKKGLLSFRYASRTQATVTVRGSNDYDFKNLELPEAGEWHHAVFVYKREAEDGVSLYIDGNLVDVKSTVGAKEAVAESGLYEMWIGANEWYSKGQRFHGVLDEVRFNTGAPAAEYVAAAYATSARDLFAYGALESKAAAQKEKYHYFDVTVKYDKSVANLPVLLRLAEYDEEAGTGINGFKYEDVINGGRDLEITDGNGDTLPYEIDTWDESGESLVWVKVPQFENGQKIRVVYGRSTTDGTARAAEVWSGYSGVWHMNTLKHGDAAPYGVYPNSTSTAGLDGKKAKRSIANESGAIGRSVRITNNTTNDFTTATYDKKVRLHYGGVFVEDSGEGSPLDAGSSKKLTISGWFKHSGVVPGGNSAYAGDNGSPFNYDRFFFKRINAANTQGGFALQMNKTLEDMKFEFASGGDTSLKSGNFKQLNAFDWSYITMVISNTNCRIYEDGVQVKSSSMAEYSDNDLMIAIGNSPLGWDGLNKVQGAGDAGDGEGERAWNGWIDEVRLAAGQALSADYVQAEYAAMSGDVLEYGAVAEEDNDLSMVELDGAPSFAWDAGANAMKFSAVVKSGKGKVYAEYTDLATGVAVTNLVADIDGAGTYPLVVSAVPSLEENHMYSFAAIAENESGTMKTRTTGQGNVYFGVVSVEKERDAVEETMTGGAFRISRAGTATAGELSLTFDISGTAVEGGTIANALVARTVTIPAGSASVEVEIPVVYNYGVAEDTLVTLALTSVTSVNPGESSETLTVVNTSNNLHVRYVSPSGDDAALGCDAAAPKKTIASAISEIAATSPDEVCTIHVAPGEYQISSAVTIKHPIHVVGEGATPWDVVVTNTSTSSSCNRVFDLANEDALVSGLTMSGGYDNGSGWSPCGAGFYIENTGGTISNCVVRDCTAVSDNLRGGVGGLMDNGLVTHTIFTNITATANPRYASVALGVKIAGYDKDGVCGRVENCLFTGCETDGSMCIVDLAYSESNLGKRQKATIRNCTIANCRIGGDGANTPYEDKGSLVENTTPVSAIIATSANCIAENCVVAGCRAADGVLLPFGSKYASYLNGVANCAADGDVANTPVGSGTYNLSDKVATGTVDDLFRNFARGDLRPRAGGPLTDAAATYDGMPETDLAGRPRVNGKGLDIGCYEGITEAFRIIMR